jgi:hypothetical protein
VNRIVAYWVSTSLLLFGVLYAGEYLNYFTIPSFGWLIIAYGALSSFGAYVLLQKRKDAMQFTQSYLLSVVAKLLIGCIFILVLILADRKGAFANALLFIVSYFIFTVLEVAFLFRKVNNPKN